MKFTHVALALSVLALQVGCDGCDEPLARLAPLVAIGDPFDPAFSVCQGGGPDVENDQNFFRDCAFDYGEIDVGRARVFQFTIRNPSPVKLQVSDISFDAGSDPAFTIEGIVPESVNPSATTGEVVAIKFSPSVEGPVSAVLRIKSDGENLDEGEDVLINLTATGTARCQPVINVSPATCDFGDVGVGATGFCDLTISNQGQCELLIFGVGFSPETPFPSVFGPESEFAVPNTIQGGTGTSLRLYARPSAAQTFEGTLFLQSGDTNNPTVTNVPLVVRGAQAPTCVAKVSRINNTPNNSAAPAIEPLDDVELSAIDSVASNPGGTIQGWQWELLSAPPESNARLDTLNTQTTRFVFDSAAGRVRGIDVAGTFVVGLVVTDDLGASSTQCTIALNSVPRSGLHVQLTWDSPENDVDLHLMRNGANWCSADDCYYGGRSRNWGSNLDIDDLNGFGPENITMDSPADGRYEVGVDMYGFDERTSATIKIFIGGALEYESSHTFTGRTQWKPARVDIAGGISTVVELNDTSPGSGSCLGSGF